MKLYLITQTDNDGYDAYRSAVVAADNPEQARRTHPDGSGRKIGNDPHASWVTDPKLVTAVEIGTAAEGVERGVVCANFSGEKEQEEACGATGAT